jgi:hypothetical protein
LLEALDEQFDLLPTINNIQGQARELAKSLTFLEAKLKLAPTKIKIKKRQSYLNVFGGRESYRFYVREGHFSANPWTRSESASVGARAPLIEAVRVETGRQGLVPALLGHLA